MSPSLAVDPRGQRGPDDRASLSWLDVALAVVLHLALLAALLMAGMWRQPPDFHPQTVTVRLIQPASLPHHARRHAHSRPATRPKPRPRPRPAVRKRVAPKPAAPKPVTPRTRKPKAEPFDPFKPLESPSNAAPAPDTPAVASGNVRELIQAQLSEQELNRYIARIQGAVQRHWKVPALTRYERDPLVLMRLNPDGSVREVKVLESSGNPALDASLKRAIYAAAPFTLPREQFEVFRENRIRFHPLR